MGWLLIAADDLHSGRYDKTERVGGHARRMITGEAEERAIAVTVDVIDRLDSMGRRVRRDGDRTNETARVARLQRRHDLTAAMLFANGEVTLPRRRIADEEERQVAFPLIVDVGDDDLLVGGNVEPRSRPVEHKRLLLRLLVRPAHRRQFAEDH